MKRGDRLVVTSGIILGVGLGGFVDGILLHQILQWHEMVSSVVPPVDLVSVNDCLLRSLRAAGGEGAWAEDDDGRQPLVALWKVDALRAALPAALASGDLSVRGLQARLTMSGVTFAGLRFGNLNTPADLQAAGYCGP